jgi:hypothetical protein
MPQVPPAWKVTSPDGSTRICVGKNKPRWNKYKYDWVCDRPTFGGKRYKKTRKMSKKRF